MQLRLPSDTVGTEGDVKIGPSHQKARFEKNENVLSYTSNGFGNVTD